MFAEIKPRSFPPARCRESVGLAYRSETALLAQSVSQIRSYRVTAFALPKFEQDPDSARSRRCFNIRRTTTASGGEMGVKGVRLLLSLLAFAVPVGAQTDLQRAASAAWNSRDWNAAVLAYSKLVAADTTQPLPHLRLGAALTALGRYADAKKQLTVAERLGAPTPQSAFRLALVDAGMGRVDS